MESTENSSSSNRSPFDDIGPENVHDNRQVSGLPSGFQLEDDDFLMSRHGLPSGAVMAVIKPTVNDPFGIAYYNELDRCIYLGEADDLSSVHNLCQLVLPGVILTSAQQGTPLLEALSQVKIGPETTAQCITLKRSDYSEATCKQKLSSLQVEEAPALRGISGNRSLQMLHWMSIIDFTKRTQVMALSGLLVYMFCNDLARVGGTGTNPLREDIDGSSGNSSSSSSSHDHHIGNYGVGRRGGRRERRMQDPLPSAFSVRAIRPLPQGETVLVDESTLQSLNIFADEVHPGNAERKKEGLSIFGILNQAKTLPGAQLLKTWIRFPSTRADVIVDRLDHIDYFLLPQNEDLIFQLRGAMRHVKDVSRVLNRFFNMSHRVADWLTLFASLQSFVAIHAIVATHLVQSADGGSIGNSGGSRRPSPGHSLFSTMTGNHSSYQFDLAALMTPFSSGNGSNPSPSSTSTPPATGPRILQVVQGALSDEVRSLNALLATVFDFPQSEREQLMVVRPGVNESLDNLKNRLALIDGFLADILSHDLTAGTLPRVFPNMYYCYFPQLGYLLAVPWEPTEPPSPTPGLDFQFQANGCVYYSTDRTKELDIELGDIQAQVHDLEREVASQVELQVMASAAAIETFAAAVYELDALFSMTLTAKDLRLTRPRVNSDSRVLKIKEGRHFLIELCVDQFVPNSLSIDKEHGTVHVIVGPNASGKSVLLKQIGIIVYLAHIGSFVPAAEAQIGICDRISCCTGLEDSITTSVSAFASDMAHMSMLLRCTTEKSLLLLDEFGSGTNTYDGTALCAAVLQHFESMGVDKSPKVLLTTHFHEMFTLGFLKESQTLRFHNMRYVVQGWVNALESVRARLAEVKQSKANQDKGGEHGDGDSRDDDPFPSLPTRPVGGELSEVSATYVAPLFQLADGWTDNSYGISCAVCAGLPDNVVQRALDVGRSIVSNTPVIPQIENISNESNDTTSSLASSSSSTSSSSSSSSSSNLSSKPTPDDDAELEYYEPVLEEFMDLIPTLLSHDTQPESNSSPTSSANSSSSSSSSSSELRSSNSSSSSSDTSSNPALHDIQSTPLALASEYGDDKGRLIAGFLERLRAKQERAGVDRMR